MKRLLLFTIMLIVFFNINIHSVISVSPSGPGTNTCSCNLYYDNGAETGSPYAVCTLASSYCDPGYTPRCGGGPFPPSFCGGGSDCSCVLSCTNNCGNGVKQCTESCDNGTSNGVVCTASYGTTCSYCTGGTGGCNIAVVTGPRCGDSVIQSGNGENCDDGNTITERCNYGVSSCTVCGSSCTSVSGLPGYYCGDGVKNGLEACDQGPSGGSTCNSDCTLKSCGGVPQTEYKRETNGTIFGSSFQVTQNGNCFANACSGTTYSPITFTSVDTPRCDNTIGPSECYCLGPGGISGVCHGQEGYCGVDVDNKTCTDCVESCYSAPCDTGLNSLSVQNTDFNLRGDSFSGLTFSETLFKIDSFAEIGQCRYCNNVCNAQASVCSGTCLANPQNSRNVIIPNQGTFKCGVLDGICGNDFQYGALNSCGASGICALNGIVDPDCPVCGDGTVQRGEQCDKGSANGDGNSLCRSDCKWNCKITGATITPNFVSPNACSGTINSPECGGSDKFFVDISYINNCSLASSVQVDYKSEDSRCTIEANGGDIVGITNPVSDLGLSGSIRLVYNLPATIPSDCLGAIMTKVSVSLKNSTGHFVTNNAFEQYYDKNNDNKINLTECYDGYTEASYSTYNRFPESPSYKVYNSSGKYAGTCAKGDYVATTKVGGTSGLPVAVQLYNGTDMVKYNCSTVSDGICPEDFSSGGSPISCTSGTTTPIVDYDCGIHKSMNCGNWFYNQANQGSTCTPPAVVPHTASCPTGCVFSTAASQFDSTKVKCILPGETISYWKNPYPWTIINSACTSLDGFNSDISNVMSAKLTTLNTLANCAGGSTDMSHNYGIYRTITTPTTIGGKIYRATATFNASIGTHVAMRIVADGYGIANNDINVLGTGTGSWQTLTGVVYPTSTTKNNIHFRLSVYDNLAGKIVYWGNVSLEDVTSSTPQLIDSNRMDLTCTSDGTTGRLCPDKFVWNTDVNPPKCTPPQQGICSIPSVQSGALNKTTFVTTTTSDGLKITEYCDILTTWPVTIYGTKTVTVK